MKFQQYLEEEYVGSFDASEKDKPLGKFTLGYTEIFKNPSMKEIKSAMETSPWFDNIKTAVRFICDFGFDNLYIFKPTTYHSNVANYLTKEKILNNARPSGNIVWGEAELKNGKLVYLSSDANHNIPLIIKNFQGKDKWTEKWFKPSLVTSFLEKGYKAEDEE